MTSETAVNKHRWLILGIVLAAEFMDLVDSQFGNVAGSSRKETLGATPSALQWDIGGNTLALGAGLELGGRLADRYSRRNGFAIGFACFHLTSLPLAIPPKFAPKSLEALRNCNGDYLVFLGPDKIGDRDSN